MDSNVTLRQIGPENLLAVGARDFIADGQQLIFRVGNGRRLAKMVVTLDGSDTYTVRYVEMDRKTYRFVKNEQREGVFCEDIGATVRDMGGR